MCAQSRVCGPSRTRLCPHSRCRRPEQTTLAAVSFRWREGRDSNPRGSFTPPTRLAGGCFRPLSHLPVESGVVARFYLPRPFHTYRSMEAPGGPGAPPMWGPGGKMAFGAAPGPRSKLWYTLADGSLSEVFFPTLDRVALHELRFFASAGGAPPVDVAADGQHAINWLSPGIPAFQVASTHHE